jgi:hypothetical protein
MFLETHRLHRFDKRALDVLFHDIEHLRRKQLAREEVLSIYNGGIAVMFTGNGLNVAPELNYALFYGGVRVRSPLILTLNCHTGHGESHAEVIQSGPPARLIVAGTVQNGTFTGISTTWMKDIQPESGRHSLGLFMNDLLLEYYHIEHKPQWSAQSTQMWHSA